MRDAALRADESESAVWIHPRIFRIDCISHVSLMLATIRCRRIQRERFARWIFAASFLIFHVIAYFRSRGSRFIRETHQVARGSSEREICRERASEDHRRDK